MKTNFDKTSNHKLFQAAKSTHDTLIDLKDKLVDVVDRDANVFVTDFPYCDTCPDKSPDYCVNHCGVPLEQRMIARLCEGCHDDGIVSIKSKDVKGWNVSSDPIPGDQSYGSFYKQKGSKVILGCCAFCGELSNSLTEYEENLLCPGCIEFANAVTSLADSGFDLKEGPEYEDGSWVKGWKERFNVKKVPPIKDKAFEIPFLRPDRCIDQNCKIENIYFCQYCVGIHKNEPGFQPAKEDIINRPSGVEVITITEHMNFCLGNAVKYIMHCDLKENGIEDLKKAKWYIEREIKRRSEK